MCIPNALASRASLLQSIRYDWLSLLFLLTVCLKLPCVLPFSRDTELGMFQKLKAKNLCSILCFITTLSQINIFKQITSIK